MITLAELNPHKYSTTQDIDKNLETLLVSLNMVRTSWGKPMQITSGLRSEADQARINPKAPKSKHLIGAAADILDDGLHLTTWLKGDGAKVLEEAGLYCEEGNANWVHFQCIPPGSGHRWFFP